MFRHRQPLRRWAARVLLLWLLGLAVPMAHACLTMGATAPVAMAVADAAVDTDCAAHQAGAAKTNCQDFCSKASVSLPSQKSVQADLQHLALFAAVALAALLLPAPMVARLRLPRHHGGHAPPIPIAFLRLTR